MVSSKRDERKVRKSIPWALHMAIVKLQGAEELEYDEACVRAAALIEEGGEKYKEAVSSEANRLYKSRFMGELNKARNTLYQRGHTDGFREGKMEGIDEGIKTYQIKYPCPRCDGDMILRPGNEDTSDAIEYLKSKGWRHSQCIKS